MKLKRKARDYFVENNLSTKAPLSWIILTSLEFFIILILMYPAFVLGWIFAAFFYGFLRGIFAITAGHSISHFSYFKKGEWNMLSFRFISPFVLSNRAIWSISHVVSHHIHTLTNDDLQDNYPVKRVQPSFKHLFFHRFQHIYIWFIYMFGLPLWTALDLVGTIPTLFTGKHVQKFQFGVITRIENFFVLAFNLLLTVGMPFFFLSFPRALTVCLISNIVSSLIVVVQIAVNHEVPDTMEQVNPKEKIDWGIHQVKTSHNFGVNSKIALHLSGGLNYQVEHHLFPNVFYIYYPALSKIVQEACKEEGLRYNESSSILEAVHKHYNLLKYCSKP